MIDEILDSIEDDTETDWEELPEIWKSAYVGDFFGVEKFLSENPDYPVDWGDLTIALAMYSSPYSSAERRLFYCRHRDNIPFMRIIKFFGEVSSTRRIVLQLVIEAVLPEAVLEVVKMIQEDDVTDVNVKQARLEKLREAFPLIATTEVISEAMSGVRL